MRRIICVALICLMSALALYIPEVSAQSGPQADVTRFKVIKGSEPLNLRLDAMLTGEADVWTDLTRTSDIEALDSNDFTVLSDLGFHMGFIGYNIRDTATIQSYYRPDISYWPLQDVAFRHALIHCYDQLGIIPPIYGYIVTPIRSLVPPAQSKYYNPSVQEHPYNPGNPFTSPTTEHSSSGILKAAGYTFVDADGSGTVTDADHWNMPNGDPMIKLTLWTPLITVAPTSWQHGQEFAADLKNIGLAATAANGGKGFESVGYDFNEYLNLVYGSPTQTGGQFDAFMVFYSLGRLPTHLYGMCRSWVPWPWPFAPNMPWPPGNPFGIHDPIIDQLVVTVKYSLDSNAIEVAAKQVQDRLYDPSLSNADHFALAIMMLYSRTYFNGYNPDIRGIVKSPGYGSDNEWTSLRIRWFPGSERIEDGKKVVIDILDDDLDRFNPLYAMAPNDWTVLDRVYDGLITVSPYNHRDVPWLASDWTVTETASGMEIDYVLRDDVYWQDGYQFTAYDVEFCLEFLRDHQVLRYWETSSILTDVVVTDATHFKVIATDPSLDAFYDFSDVAAMLPPQIWNRTWPSNQAILDYQPDQYAYGTDMAPGYSSGPWAANVSTNVFGTGPWIFQFYNTESGECDLYANRNHFMTQSATFTLLADLFWEIGDFNRDGIINVIDLTLVSFGFGAIIGDPGYDANADFNCDGIIDLRDMRLVAFHLGWKREYP